MLKIDPAGNIMRRLLPGLAHLRWTRENLYSLRKPVSPGAYQAPPGKTDKRYIERSAIRPQGRRKPNHPVHLRKRGDIQGALCRERSRSGLYPEVRI